MGFLILKKRGLGDLKLQPSRRKPGLHQSREYDLEEVILFELDGRDIDRQLDVRGPGSGVRASPPQNPFAKRHDKTGCLRKRNELVRCDQTLGRMAPPDQRLDAAKRSRLRIHDGLVMQLEFLSLDGVAQLDLRRPLRIGNLEQLILKEPVLVPSIGLDVVERKVGSLQETLRVRLMFRSQNDTDAGPDIGPVTVEIERLRDGIDDPKRKRNGGLVLIGPALLDDRKFVTAQSRQDIGFPDRGLQTCSDFNQQLVSGRMPQRVVDGFKPVEVNHHDRDRAAVPFQAPAYFLELRVEFGAVRKSGQRVVAREMDDLRLRPSPLGDVFVRCQPSAVGHRLAGNQDEAAIGKFVDPARCGILGELIQ